jgi:WD40 repeat protein
MDCPSSEDLQRFVDGTLDETDSNRLREHIGICSECKSTVDARRKEAETERWRKLLHFGQAQEQQATPDFFAKLVAEPAVSDFHEPALRAALKDAGLEVIEKIGQGGFGIVFTAKSDLHPIVAVKVLLRGTRHSEPQLIASVKNAHVVQVFRDGVLPELELPYLVMEFVDGESLGDRLWRCKRIEPHEAALLTRQAAIGLHAVHESGFVHRDVKPANILLERDGGLVKLVDFGLAVPLDETLSQAHAAGTLQYMSPEQLEGHGTIAPKSDVYSIGVVLYQMVTGELPFRGESGVLLRKILQDDPEPPTRLNPELPRDLENICLKCIAKNRDSRYDSAAALAEDLQRFIEGKPTIARPIGPSVRFWRWSRRNRGWAAALVLGLASVFVIGLLLAWGFLRERGLNRELASEVEKTTNANVVIRQQATTEQKLRAAAEELLYDTKIRLAAAAWDSNRLETLLRLLRETTPQGDDVDRRGFEWWYLHHLFTQSSVILAQGGESSSTAMSVSPDHSSAVIAYSDGELERWDLVHGKPVASVATGLSQICGVEIGSAGLTCIVAQKTGVVSEWSFEMKKKLREVTADESGLWFLTTNAARGTFATAGKKGFVRVFDINTFTEQASKQVHQALVTSVAFSPDGERLASTSADQRLRIWNWEDEAADAETMLTLSDPAWSAAFSADGTSIAVGDTGSNAHVIRLSDGEIVFRRGGHNATVVRVALSADATRLYSADATGIIRVTPIADPANAVTLRGHTSRIAGLQVLDSDLLSLSSNGLLRRWPPEPPTAERHGYNGWVFAAAPNEDASRIVLAGVGHEIVAVSGDDTIEIAVEGKGKAINDLLIDPMNEDRIYAAVLVDGVANVREWTIGDDTEFRMYEGITNNILDIDFAQDRKLIAASCYDGRVRLFNTADGKITHTTEGMKGQLWALDVSKSDRWIAAASAEGSVYLTEFKDDALSDAARILASESVFVDVAISPDESFVAAIALDGRVHIHKIDTSEDELKGTSFKAHLDGEGARCLCFSLDGRRLFTGGNGIIHVWRLPRSKALAANWRQIAPLLSIPAGDGRIWTMEMSPDGRTLVAGGEDRSAHLIAAPR